MRELDLEIEKDWIEYKCCERGKRKVWGVDRNV